MLGAKLKACLAILRGRGVLFAMRVWREGDVLCLTSSDRKGGGHVSHCIFDAKDGFEAKPGPVLKIDLKDAAPKKEDPR